MNGALLHYAGEYCSVTTDLGGLRYVSPHTGMDRDPSVDVVFAHGSIAMSSATLRELMSRGGEALTKQGREHSR